MAGDAVEGGTGDPLLASWFIDDLMRHRGRQYYVALLTAAALHGAGHQQPMAFQVIADAVERDVEVGRVRVEFHVSNLVEGAATEGVQTETGSMVVSTPETTAFDPNGSLYVLTRRALGTPRTRGR